jgi:hypothetical protein
MSTDEAMRMWKHFADIGGNDKDRMVAMSTWLLGFSSAILWFAVTQGLPFKSHLASIIVSILGLIPSALTVYVTLMYGGYANRNWSHADAIAKAFGWDFLTADNDSHCRPTKDKGAKWALRIAWHASTTREPLERLAPVFMVFLGLGLLSTAAYTIMLSASIAGGLS